MSEKEKNGEDLFASAMADVRPAKEAGAHVSRRSNAALVISLRRGVDDLLRSHPGARDDDPSSRQVDGRTLRRIKQGKIKIDARIDLHGDRFDAARENFRRFIARAAHQGHRCVLVITGKGAPPDGDQSGRGVIRRALPGWAAEAPLDQWILRLETAKERDGGAGAVYVYLRRAR